MFYKKVKALNYVFIGIWIEAHFLIVVYRTEWFYGSCGLNLRINAMFLLFLRAGFDFKRIHMDCLQYVTNKFKSLV